MHAVAIKRYQISEKHMEKQQLHWILIFPSDQIRLSIKNLRFSYEELINLIKFA